jgi:ankyrin repeat protein
MSIRHPPPVTRRRRILFLFAAVLGVLAASTIAFVLWLWWPNANKLHRYAVRGDVAGVRLCLRFGVDPNAPSRWGWTLENDGQTPLTTAAQYGHVEVTRVLLKSGADPNLRDFGSNYPQNTPLATAAMHGQLEVCRVLLAAGADPNVPTNPKQPGEPGNWTALDWAIRGKQSAVADLLRAHGAVESGRRRDDGG